MYYYFVIIIVTIMFHPFPVVLALSFMLHKPWRPIIAATYCLLLVKSTQDAATPNPQLSLTKPQGSVISKHTITQLNLTAPLQGRETIAYPHFIDSPTAAELIL